MTDEFDDFDLDDDLDFDLEEDDLDFDLEEDDLDFDLEEEDDFLDFDFTSAPSHPLLERPTTLELKQLVAKANKCKDLPATLPRIGEAATDPAKTLTLKQEMNNWFALHKHKPEQPVYRAICARCAHQLLAGHTSRTVVLKTSSWSTAAFVCEYKPETDIVRVSFKLPEGYLKFANVDNLKDHYTGWFNNTNGMSASTQIPFKLH